MVVSGKTLLAKSPQFGSTEMEVSFELVKGMTDHSCIISDKRILLGGRNAFQVIELSIHWKSIRSKEE